ncbi:MAG: hypothetical protein JKY95_12665 [Planctomycetaceae bacterium]|nr:hypothetical protein [Planctomycetaceae bacterium]
MQRYCRKLLIGLLVLAFSHAPIPWVHQHAGMNTGQLSAHSRLWLSIVLRPTFRRDGTSISAHSVRRQTISPRICQS